MNIYQVVLLAAPLFLLNLNVYRQLKSNWKEDGFVGFLGHLALLTFLLECMALAIAVLFYGIPRLHQFYLYLGTLS